MHLMGACTRAAGALRALSSSTNWDAPWTGHKQRGPTGHPHKRMPFWEGFPIDASGRILLACFLPFSN